ncbi:MAG: peptide/nickel transport system substrate-binding protein [Gaiellales bacterium]|nr:peptide/nickel transport system substrate-binding protein [Gaiellales bacterium]
MTNEPPNQDRSRAELIDQLLRRPMNRREALKRAGAAGLALNGITILAAACGGSSANTGGGTAKAGAAAKQLVIASGATPVTLDPMVSLDGQSPLLWRCSYEPLLRFKGATIEVEPHLAEAYEYDTNANQAVFHLRPDVTFTDGTALDAKAVKLNIERQMALEQGIAYALSPVTKVETPDDQTVVVHLSGFSDGLLYGFASLYGLYMISPKAITDNKGDDWAQAWLSKNMVGTGPYQLQNYELNQQASFIRNDTYWGGWEGEHFESVLVQYVTDPSTERLQLERGDSHIAVYLPDDVIYAMRDKENVTVSDDPSFNVYYLGLPCRTGPTADKAVRQAISYGFDYDSWVNDVLNGTGTQARGPLPEIFPGYDSSVPQYTYDVDKARSMLADAGFEGGGFSLKYIYETGYYWKRPLGELFQSNMKDLGIDVTIQELSPSTWVGTLSNKDKASEAYGVVWWPSLATPFDFLWALFATSAQGTAGYNFTYYSNPQFDGLLDQATAEPDEAKRTALYNRCQHIVVEDAPYLFLSDVRYLVPTSPKLTGFEFNGMYINSFDPYALGVSA